MPLDQDEELLERIRTKLFGNLVHYRQHCISETDDAKQVARFIEREARGKLADWRCVGCKFVHYSCQEPQHCFHCSGRTFALIDGSTQ